MLNTRRVSIGVLLAAALLPITAVSAATLNYGTQLNPAKCEGKIGPAIINVTQKVINDADSGLGGWWAYDHYVRHIQVWQVEDNEYCALVEYFGRFDAQAGETSPGNTAILDGDEDGIIQGGYRAHISGALLASPAWKKLGSVGAFDYACTIQNPAPPDCPGRVNWIDQYFAPGSDFEYEWWGWIYRAGVHGTWINSSDGNSGNIS